MHEIVILVAEYFILIPIIGAVYVLIMAPKKQRLRLLALLVLGGILSELFAKIGSHLYYDPRPFVANHIVPYFTHAPDNGFPSDHTLLAAFLAYWTRAFRRRLGLVLLIVALLIGIARVIAGVHHLYDIIGSLVFAGLGCIAAFGIIWMAERAATARAE